MLDDIPLAYHQNLFYQQDGAPAHYQRINLLLWKMNNDDINNYIPSILNPRTLRKQDGDISLTQNSVVSRCSLSLKRNNVKSNIVNPFRKVFVEEKENTPNEQNGSYNIQRQTHKKVAKTKTISTNNIDCDSIGFSAIEDIYTYKSAKNKRASSLGSTVLPNCVQGVKSKNVGIENADNNSVVSVSSATELSISGEDKSSDVITVIYEVAEKPHVNISFGVIKSEAVDITTKNINIKKISVTNSQDITTYDCTVVESTQISTQSELYENMNESSQPNSQKRSAVAVNLEFKKKKMTAGDKKENSKVLILNTNAIEKVSHVIVQPPNYKIVKRQIVDKYKSRGKRKGSKSVNNGKGSDCLKQKTIDSYLSKNINVVINVSKALLGDDAKCSDALVTSCDDVKEMSKTSGVAESKCDRTYRGLKSHKLRDDSPKSVRLVCRNSIDSSKPPSSEAPRVVSPRKNESFSSQSPKKNSEVIQYAVASRSKSTRSPLCHTKVPHYKIVSGTHFAVDAFSYGDIPHVKHYFLTHFHSDHYSGLKKGFNKILFCSNITAELCMSRLGVNPKCIHILKLDETIKIDGVEIAALDANHCPGALMLVFTLPNGKTILHTGDFRASPVMESYPVFWNREIHTVYLDTTYCNPRYDFPTQDQSLEMALYILRQKKLAVESAGKNFGSVLIVCGTYTIGKERFFLGMARRVGCSVWACPEKDRVLQVVEGRSFCQSSPECCQLHVVPMRDLTHDKLRNYLESLEGAFSEVVAFKPSGWENGKNTAVEQNLVTIHGIPYSEHSSFSELIRFVKYLKPKQVVPTVDISGGIKSVQKYFPCPLIYKEDMHSQSKVTDYFSIQSRPQVPAVT